MKAKTDDVNLWNGKKGKFVERKFDDPHPKDEDETIVLPPEVLDENAESGKEIDEFIDIFGNKLLMEDKKDDDELLELFLNDVVLFAPSLDDTDDKQIEEEEGPETQMS